MLKTAICFHLQRIMCCFPAGRKLYSIFKDIMMPPRKAQDFKETQVEVRKVNRDLQVLLQELLAIFNSGLEGSKFISQGGGISSALKQTIVCPFLKSPF